jgi:pimeloyl-ACP methyl ester carboxylesterase
MLEDGESLLDAVGGEPPDWFIYSDDGEYIEADRPEEIFYNDVSSETTAESVRRLKHFSSRATQQPQDGAAWRELPSTYVVCEKDNAIPSPAQEAMSQRASRVRRMDASHSPFLSKPREIAEILRDALPATS